MRAKVAAAFAAVYLIWGSTYLAISFVEESLPPFFMAGTRFLIAGSILYAWTRLRGTPRETRSDWGKMFVTGGLMLLGGHGAVIWAEQWVPSGLTSLLVSTVPLWMVLSNYLWNRSKPNAKVAAGLALGFAGVILLAGGVESLGASSVDITGATILVFGAFLWANGSLYSRSARLSSSPLLGTAIEMLAGGLLLLIASLILGEWTHIRLDLVSARSAVSWVYLIVFGSLVGFTSYIWLLKNVPPSQASTYAYVNPIVAMFLGWALAHEPFSLRNAVAAAIILAAVVIITAYQTKEKSSENIKT
ncbi:MAG: EamA family transporter [Candidatus Bathyarchaeia archaeon]